MFKVRGSEVQGVLLLLLLWGANLAMLMAQLLALCFVIAAQAKLLLCS